MNKSFPYEMLSILINKAMYTGKTDQMDVLVPYDVLMDHPDQEYQNIKLKISIVTEWVTEGDSEDE